MADLKKRITSLTEKTTLTSGDFAAVDNTSGGTKKYNLYQLTQAVADNVASIDSLETAVDGLTSDMAEKADTDGSYEGMTAGNAEQLLSDVYTEDSEPYKYRASFSGDREFDEIVGGTVAWNQLRLDSISSYTADGITTSFDSTTHKFCIENLSRTSNYGSGSTQLTASNTAAINGHVYLFDTDAEDGVYIVPTTGSSIMISSVARIYKMTSAATAFRLRVTNQYDFVTRHPVGNKYYFYGNIIDLTALFGSTIADYILAQEQATAGAGVAIFRKMFGASYYPFNSGELISVSGLSAHVTTSKNLVCGKIENANMNATGYIVANTNFHMYYAEVKAGFTYKVTATGNQFVGGYFTDLPALSTNSYDHIRIVSNDTVIIPPIDGYVCFRCEVAFATPQVEIGSVATAYSSEYWKRSYPLDSSLTLRGIPKLANGKMYFDGDTYASDGTVTRRYGIVDLGTLTWSQPRTSEFRAMISTIVPTPQIAERSSVKGNIICSKYPTVTADETYQQYRGVAISANQATGYVSVYDSTYTDAATFKTAMSGVYLVYELATPTTETAEPFTNPQIVSEYGTEEYVSGTICPVGHNTKYPENLRKKIEGLPWNLSMIAPIENGTTASKAYSVGQYFLHNNIFCKAKTSIASGATFTLNTNYEETTVAAELYSALH